MATVRYLVKDVEKSIEFYCENLGFSLIERFGSAMAIVERDDLRLWLAGPHSSAQKPLPNGEAPQPGGWNRLVLETDDLALTVARLREVGVRFKVDMVQGPGGKQALCEDPSGNVIEFFE